MVTYSHLPSSEELCKNQTRLLAHWTITQRTIRVILPMKAVNLENEKHNWNGIFGEAIRAARQKIGMTQENLAVASGIHRQWIGRWERNRAIPSLAEQDKLNEVLKINRQQS